MLWAFTPHPLSPPFSPCTVSLLFSPLTGREVCAWGLPMGVVDWPGKPQLCFLLVVTLQVTQSLCFCFSLQMERILLELVLWDCWEGLNEIICKSVALTECLFCYFSFVLSWGPGCHCFCLWHVIPTSYVPFPSS